MVRKQYFIRNDQARFLNKLQGNDAEHVRAAIDDYILKKRKEGVGMNVAISNSRFITKGGESDARTNNIPSTGSI